MLILDLVVVGMVEGYSHTQPRLGGTGCAGSGLGKTGDNSGSGDATHGDQKMIPFAS